MVECDLAKVEVAGSTPVSRSITCSLLPLAHARVYALRSDQASTQFEARYPSGKGEVCKTFMRRFDPDPRLQSFNHLTFGMRLHDCAVGGGWEFVLIWMKCQILNAGIMIYSA